MTNSLYLMGTEPVAAGKYNVYTGIEIDGGAAGALLPTAAQLGLERRDSVRRVDDE